MEQLTVEKDKVQEVFDRCTPAQKIVLQQVFGKEVLSDGDWIRLFSDFCKENNLIITYDESESGNPGYVYLPHKNPRNADQENTNSFQMMKAIVGKEVEQWNKENPKANFPDWHNKKQEKWFAVWEMTEAGFAFSYASCAGWTAHSRVGSRLSLPTEQHVKDNAKKYLAIWQKLQS